MAERPKRWRLFLDESGDFARATQDVALGGVLIAEDARKTGYLTLERAIEQNFPGIPRPFHAAYANKPTFVAFAIGSVPWDATTVPISLLRHVSQCLELLEREEKTTYDRVSTALRQGRRPRFDDIVSLDRLLLTRLPHSRHAIEDHVRGCWATLNRTLETIARTQRDARQFALLAGSERSTGGAYPTKGTGSAAETERWYVLLEDVLRRVIGLLTQIPGRHDVFVGALGRDVWEPTVGVSAALHPRHIRDVIGRIGSGTTDRVRLLPWETPALRPDVHPAYLLADAIVFASRPALSRANRPLRWVEGRIEQRLGLRPRSGNPGQSHLSASGPVVASKPKQWSIDLDAELVRP